MYPQWTFTSYNGSGNAAGTDVFGNGQVELMSDTVTPGYKERSAAGEVIMTPLTSSDITRYQAVTSQGYIVRTGIPTQWYQYGGALRTLETHGVGPGSVLTQAAGGFIIPYSTYDQLASEVSTAVLSKIGRASTDTWENMAEARKSLNMLWSPLSSWFAFERKAKMKSVGMSAANAWLMYRYGIRPLVGSVHDIMTAVQNGLKTERVTSRATRSVSASEPISGTRVGYGVTYQYTGMKTESAIVRGMSLDELTTDWRYQYGLDAKSLLTLPWNLISYSFVVDWFVNVADLIGALGQVFQPASLGRALVTKQVATCTISATSTAWPSGYTIVTPYSGIVREDALRTQRSVGLKSPSLVVKSDFRFHDMTRLVDAVALVGQQLLKRFGKGHKPKRARR